MSLDNFEVHVSQEELNEVRSHYRLLGELSEEDKIYIKKTAHDAIIRELVKIGKSRPKGNLTDRDNLEIERLAYKAFCVDNI